MKTIEEVAQMYNNVRSYDMTDPNTRHRCLFIHAE